MHVYRSYQIKSFKHNGSLHRTWLENWLVPEAELTREHRSESMLVLINQATPIREANGKCWVSRVPALSFFIPEQWFNVVALLERSGIRYYCNVASPPYVYDNVLTYIDYDLDVIRTVEGAVHVVDRDEYEYHKALYHYPAIVEEKVKAGLHGLTARIRLGQTPFDEAVIRHYYERWLHYESEGGKT
ncbi:DUF402 domain-containing protein [Paenibacillus sp. IB182496]|uniref:DUF402 domain-containing protein n=1 Tax=Paenibacillus sabuli TaxID=2772509 RepID=A0A927BWW0_9BACL|nr:DUF402 domain-containing protein [Paenibacillus sabuli]MBD2848366.1 DUF402 domain-containing protein [Paenibacillus sabuli]